jgi:polyisoprenoid-binding protein YceI
VSFPAPDTRRRWPRRLALAVGVVVVLAVALPFAYIHFINKKAPPKLALTPPRSETASGRATAPGSATVAGRWAVGSGSLVGYRVNETLLGQRATAVGRTVAVSGSLTIDATKLTAASFTAQMADVKSNEPQRDAQFDGRIMDVASYPTATFTLTRAIALGSVPPVGTVRSYTATGNLMLRGQTRPVHFELAAERSASGLEVQGDIPILFATWKVPNPSFGSFVTTADRGTLEFLLRFTKGPATMTARGG